MTTAFSFTGFSRRATVLAAGAGVAVSSDCIYNVGRAKSPAWPTCVRTFLREDCGLPKSYDSLSEAGKRKSFRQTRDAEESASRTAKVGVRK